MPSVKWQYIRSHPIKAVKIFIVSTLRSIVAVASKIINPSQPLSFRTALVRAWYGTSFITDSDIWYSEPEFHNIHKFATSKTETAYIVPTTEELNIVKELRNADVVYLYAHGGGLFIGHPLQYLTEYKRWVSKAQEKGKKMVIIAPHYPLSPVKKWPAQRDSFLAAYSFILSSGVPASRIVFGGDSGGANLVLLSLLYLRDHCTLDSSLAPPLSLPIAAVIHSPSIDLTSAKTQFTPRIKYDYILTYPSIAPYMNDTLRPIGLPFDTPEISALLHEDVSKLPPQLVYWSPTEILATDASRWIERSIEAGTEITEHKGRGMLHTYSLGWPFVGRDMQEECDGLLMRFLFEHVKGKSV
ncbi:alpha/beta-hydrolase [Hyaloscypha variabilis]